MSKKSLMGSSASLPDTTSWSEPKETVLHLGDNVLGVIKPGPPTGPMNTGTSTACIDCRTETQPNKAAGNYEQFIVTDEVWQAAGMPLGNVDPKSFVLKGGGGCLCVGCIERRLGRRLTNADFVWQEGLWENRDAGWLTPRLVERLATGMADPRPIPKVDA